MQKFLLVSGLLLAALHPAQAQLWRKTRVQVTPGQGIPSAQLGKPLGKPSERYLGKPTLQEAANAEVGSGLMVYGTGDSRDLKKGILLRLNDGKSPKNVATIQLKGIRAATPEGVYLGAPASLISKKYPRAQQDTNPFSRQPEFSIPGLTIRTNAGKVEEFVVESSASQRWRFSRLQVTPGQGAGPFIIGKAVPPEAFDLLGPPTTEVKPGKTASSGLLRWSTAGQNPTRMIEVTLHDGRNPKAVVNVRVRGVEAHTAQRIKIGDSEAAVRDLFPDGREGLLDSGTSWRIPGLNFGFRNNQLREMQIYAVPNSGRTRR